MVIVPGMIHGMTIHSIMDIMVDIHIIVIMADIHIMAIHIIMDMQDMDGIVLGIVTMLGVSYYGYRRVYYSHNGHTGTANHWGNAPRSFGNQSRSRAYNDYGQPGYSTPRNNIGQNQYDRSMDTYQSQFGGARQSDYNNQSRQVYSRPDNSFSQPSRSSFGETTRGSFGRRKLWRVSRWR